MQRVEPDESGPHQVFGDEKGLQKEVVKYLRHKYPDVPIVGGLIDDAIYWAKRLGLRIPSIASKVGYKCGQPDLMIPVATLRSAGLAIELKRPFVPRDLEAELSEYQLDYHACLRRAGWRVEVLSDIDEICRVIEEHMSGGLRACVCCKKPKFFPREAVELHEKERGSHRKPFVRSSPVPHEAAASQARVPERQVPMPHDQTRAVDGPAGCQAEVTRYLDGQYPEAIRVVRFVYSVPGCEEQLEAMGWERGQGAILIFHANAEHSGLMLEFYHPGESELTCHGKYERLGWKVLVCNEADGVAKAKRCIDDYFKSCGRRSQRELLNARALRCGCEARDFVRRLREREMVVLLRRESELRRSLRKERRRSTSKRGPLLATKDKLKSVRRKIAAKKGELRRL